MLNNKIPNSKSQIPNLGIWCLVLGISFSIFMSCTPRSFDDGLRKAEEQVGLGNFKKAAKTYQHIIEEYPKDPRIAVVWLRLGDLYAYSTGEIKKGLEAYQRGIETQPASEAARIAHERRAQLFEREGHASGMIEEYTALLKYFPDHSDTPKYRIRLGEAYIMSGEYQQARTELREFVEKMGVPSDQRERALFDIGETYFLEGKPGKAVRFYYTLIEENQKSPLSSETKLRIATCLEEMGYLGTARKFAEEAGKDYPNQKVIEERLSGMEKRGKKPR